MSEWTHCKVTQQVKFYRLEFKVQYSSNPRKLSSKVHSLVGRAITTVPTPSVPWNSPERWVWWSDQRGSGMPFYWTVYPTCLSETLVFQYTSREIWRQEESYKVKIWNWKKGYVYCAFFLQYMYLFSFYQNYLLVWPEALKCAMNIYIFLWQRTICIEKIF